MLYDMGFCFYIEFLYFFFLLFSFLKMGAMDVIILHHANHCV